MEIEFGVTKLPHFEVPEGYDSWTYLNKLCYDGLYERYGVREDVKTLVTTRGISSSLLILSSAAFTVFCSGIP